MHMNKLFLILGILITSFIIQGSYVHASESDDEVGMLPKAGLTPLYKLISKDT